jgi:hypothetical protein
MDADEQDVVNYLKSWSGQYVSGREVARRAASKKRFQKEPDWAIPVLLRLVEKGVVESDSMAHYRMAPEAKRRKPKRWLSPEMQKILQDSGKEPGEAPEIDDSDSSNSSGKGGA